MLFWRLLNSSLMIPCTYEGTINPSNQYENRNSPSKYAALSIPTHTYTSRRNMVGFSRNQPSNPRTWESSWQRKPIKYLDVRRFMTAFGPVIHTPCILHQQGDLFYWPCIPRQQFSPPCYFTISFTFGLEWKPTKQGDGEMNYVRWWRWYPIISPKIHVPFLKKMFIIN